MDVQGLFINICALYWQRGGNLTLTEAKRRLLLSKPKAFDSLIENGLIKVDNDNLTISFLEEQIQEREEKHEINSANGRLGGRPKKPKAFISLTETKGNKRREEEDKIRTDKKGDGLDFTLFWDKYEKKVGASDCKKKWDKLPKETQEKILVHLDVYVPATPDPTYRKNPATYLNQEAWNDEVIPAKEKTQLPRFL